MMGCFLGVDVGSKTLGLAVSDPGGVVALPLAVVRRTSLERDLEALGRWLAHRQVTDVVIGWPLNLDGGRGALATEAERVGAAIAARFGLALHRWDERLTTVAAERALLQADLSRQRRKQVIDKVAAALMLQAFLDHRRAAGGPGAGKT